MSIYHNTLLVCFEYLAQKRSFSMEIMVIFFWTTLPGSSCATSFPGGLFFFQMYKL